MSSDDIIELGSSDEDSGPAPKRKKPMLNAMVHIPTNLPGITIKSTKSKKGIPLIQVNKPNVAKLSNSCKFPNNTLLQETSVNPIILKKNVKKHVYIQNKNKLSINPMSFSKNVCKTNQLTGQVQVHSGVLNNLPPSITIKKTAKEGAMIVKSTSGVCKNSVIPKFPEIRKRDATKDYLGNEISQHLTTTPQWYLRPNEKGHTLDDTKEEVTDFEQKNNAEPGTENFVEIVIEDSPIKHQLQDKLAEIGRELPIVIEDSPLKVKEKKLEEPQSFEKRFSPSKKKLIYPNVEKQMVEIEIDPIKPKETDDAPTTSNMQEDTNQFHPVYQTFIDTCFQLENSTDMQKIVEKKIKAYYKQCLKEYVESEEFLDMVSSKTSAMKAGPSKMFLYIKDVVDELNLQRKLAKSLNNNTNQENIELDCIKEDIDDVNECDTKRVRQIRKLEKTIKKLHRAIKKLEEQEVDFDDEDDSVYLLTERYKERLVRVHAKFCQVTNTKMPSEPRIIVDAREGRPMGPAKKLEKLINKKVPIGTHLPFPDFHDVVRCVREANIEDKLEWNEIDILEEARDLFARCGKKMQKRRQENEWRIATSRISMDRDPAENCEDLRQKLDENKITAAKKETELVNQFADKQNQLNLEAVEIGDGEAEESPVESEEDDPPDDSSSMEDKYKRKKTLRKLLQTKNMSNKEDVEVDVTKAEEENENGKKENTIEENNINIEINIQKLPVDDKDNISDESIKQTEGCESLSSDIDSDIDELHLLQKLHSENERNTSSSQTSDSDGTTNISDTLDSDIDSENENRPCDVISIEDSSYSESEILAEDYNKKVLSVTHNDNITELVNENFDTELSTEEKEGIQKSNEDSMENLLLASSSEEGKSLSQSEKDIYDDLGPCINLKDDNISISETYIEGLATEDNEHNKNIVKDVEREVTIFTTEHLEEQVIPVNDTDNIEPNIESITAKTLDS